MLRQLFLIVPLMLALFTANDVLATVYYSKQEALELAFGKDASVEINNVFLTDEQTQLIERTAKQKLDSQMFTFYVGKKNEQIVGYAAIESHTVRTQPETLLIVLSPAGQVTRVEVLAFHEPPEYQPPARWFTQLLGKPLAELELNQGVDGVVGATLSTRSAVETTRKVVAVYQAVLASPGKE